jgi:hypothetical protein
MGCIERWADGGSLERLGRAAVKRRQGGELAPFSASGVLFCQADQACIRAASLVFRPFLREIYGVFAERIHQKFSAGRWGTDPGVGGLGGWGNGKAALPLIVSTWGFGKPANDQALAVLQQGGRRSTRWNRESG